MTSPRPLEIIVTLNQHLLDKKTLNRFLENGATRFRINGSHVLPEDVVHYVAAVRSAVGSRVKLLLDLPGNKVRTTNISTPISLTPGGTFVLTADQFNFPKFIDFLQPGDRVLANDSRYSFTVKSVDQGAVTFTSFSEGELIGNKGVHLTKSHPPLPILFQRDRDLIAQAIQNQVDFLGVSFVRTAADVKKVAELVQNSPVQMMVKIETREAITNLDEIVSMNGVDEFLVDRGDLSCDVGLENIDFYQKQILFHVKQKKKAVFFATQFLVSMLDSRTPLISEITSLTDVLNAGVDGIQLSEETAIGKYPMEVLQLIGRANARQAVRRKLKKNNFAPVLWLTGRSGSGKTTISQALKTQLEGQCFRVGLVDGDEYRSFLGGGIGYKRQDRIFSQKNIAFTAYQASQVFDIVIVASLSPYQEMRDFARERITNFHEVYIQCPVKTCEQRDPKGHYKRAAEGKLQDFLSDEDDYEAPTRPELVVNTEENRVQDCVQEVVDYLHRF